MEVVYTRAALAALKRMPVNTSRLIRSKTVQYAADPNSLANNVTEVKGSTYKRLRVCDWRIIMDDKGLVLDILDIGPHGGIYG